MMQTSVDGYLNDGCGRCDHFQTPACKVHLWRAPLSALRALLRETELVEEMKWGSPCYTVGGKNVVMLASLRGYCALDFFKGAALADPAGMFETHGSNSHFVRLLRFTSLDEVEARREAIRGFLAQAIAFEKAGGRIERPTEREPVPDELAARLEVDAALRQAFEALTPGRQRSHILHISGAKQAATREKRVERCAVDILAGRGFNER
jgi:uncharacterized protein YdeI (YjbR/CyaY-like superfamily)